MEIEVNKLPKFGCPSSIRLNCRYLHTKIRFFCSPFQKVAWLTEANKKPNKRDSSYATWKSLSDGSYATWTSPTVISPSDSHGQKIWLPPQSLDRDELKERPTNSGLFWWTEKAPNQILTLLRTACLFKEHIIYLRLEQRSFWQLSAVTYRAISAVTLRTL